MKTQLFFGLFWVFFCWQQSMAQVSTASNIGAQSDFVGWNANQGFPLQIIHRGNQPMVLVTNNILRMAIANGPGGIGGGRVAFSNNLPNNFVPQDRLHSFINSAADNMFRFSNTGFAANQGFRLGQDAQGNGLFDLLDQGIFKFDMPSNLSTSAPRLTKVTIDNINQANVTNTFQPTYVNSTRVGIWQQSGFANGSGTLAMLHLGQPGNLNTITHRDWMNIGTYYNEGGDAMYVGLRQVGSNVTDAVIAWGDDGNDRLKFIFNTQLNQFPNNPSSSNDGLEVARFVSFNGLDGRVLFNIDPTQPNLDPQNTVHIVGIGSQGNSTTPGGNSGLRLNYANSSTPTIANPGAGVLSVNALGDVVYVQAPTAGGAGNSCNALLNPLFTDYTVPLNGNDYYFSDDAALSNKINFGYPCGSINLPGKTNAYTAFASNTSAGLPQSITSFAENAHSVSFLSTAGFYGTASNVAFGGDAAGVWGYADASRNAFGLRGVGGTVTLGQSIGAYVSSQIAGNSQNIGLRADADNAPTNYGVLSLASGGANSTGGYFFAGGASLYNIGVTAIGQQVAPNSYTGFYPSANIGVYAAGDPNNTLAGTTQVGSNWAGWFDGDVYINGFGYYPGFFMISDGKFKQDIQPITDASALVARLKPSTYSFIDGKSLGIALPEKTQYGFISQEVEKVMPELVQHVSKPAMVDSSGVVQFPEIEYKAVNYIAFIALLTASMQEQQVKLNQQEVELQSIKHEMEAIKELLYTKSVVVELRSDAVPARVEPKGNSILHQNVPNPFSESTKISYEINQEFSRAYIGFMTLDGKLIKSINISAPGLGQLELRTAELSSGVYLYNLIIDGVVVDTKRLIKN